MCKVANKCLNGRERVEVVEWKKMIEKKRKKKKEIIYSTEVLKCNLCDYSDAFILVRGDIAVTADPETQVALKKCAPFTKCIIKIDGTTI